MSELKKGTRISTDYGLGTIIGPDEVKCKFEGTKTVWCPEYGIRYRVELDNNPFDYTPCCFWDIDFTVEN